MIDRLLGLRLRGYLAIAAERIPSALVSTSDRHRASRTVEARESVHHRWLKEIAYRWARWKFTCRLDEEVRLFGSRYDLASEKAEIVVECGNSAIDLAFNAMRQIEWSYFLLPYSASAEMWHSGTGRSVFIYRLWLTDEGLDWLEDHEFETLRRASRTLEFRPAFTGGE